MICEKNVSFVHKPLEVLIGRDTEEAIVESLLEIGASFTVEKARSIS